MHLLQPIGERHPPDSSYAGPSPNMRPTRSSSPGTEIPSRVTPPPPRSATRSSLRPSASRGLGAFLLAEVRVTLATGTKGGGVLRLGCLRGYKGHGLVQSWLRRCLGVFAASSAAVAAALPAESFRAKLFGDLPSSPPLHLPAAGSRGLRPWAPATEEDTSTHSLFTARNHHHPVHIHAPREQRPHLDYRVLVRGGSVTGGAPPSGDRPRARRRSPGSAPVPDGPLTEPIGRRDRRPPGL